MNTPSPLSFIALPLVEWYRANRRDLPWRNSPTPYQVWVSEIMLQQTRVEAVKPYYARFLSALPTVKDLAEAPEELLLKLWEGLGYYSRVRNMQKAAKEICSRFGGELPASYKDLLSLPGIGPYTAGAISAFAFGLPEVAVDGNVLRVVARLLADDRNILDEATKKDFEAKLREIIPAQAPGDFGQGLIELGATVCLPGRGEVHCEKCPLREHCQAHAQGLVEILPVRFKEQKRKIQQKTVLVLVQEGKVLLQKRPQKGLLAGLWELPNLEGHLSAEEVQSYVKALGGKTLSISPLPQAKHIFTHITWEMIGYALSTDGLIPKDTALFLSRQQLQALAIPSAFSAYRPAIEKETAL